MVGGSFQGKLLREQGVRNPPCPETWLSRVLGTQVHLCVLYLENGVIVIPTW